jgi:hypothetical protein
MISHIFGHFASFVNIRSALAVPKFPLFAVNALDVLTIPSCTLVDMILANRESDSLQTLVHRCILRIEYRN